MNYLLAFVLAFGTTALLTPIVRRLAFRIGAVDRPGDARRIHKIAIARLGGLAIFAGFLLAVLVYLPLTRPLAGLLAGCLVVMVVGVIDDIRGVSAGVKLLWQVVAASLALAGGIGITFVNNPFGGIIDLQLGRTLVELGPLSFHITPIANTISLIWIVGIINTVNFLDGLDGLASGVSGIAAFIMFLLAISPRVNQPEVAILAIILAGAAWGFLPFNFFPAKIFMGDSGAYLLGLCLALLAIYSGAKLATAALVLGFTIIDALLTAGRRIYRRQMPYHADRTHIHHLLLDIGGLSQRQTVLLFYCVALAFGLVALSVGTFAKLVGFVAVSLAMVVLTSWLIIRAKRLERVK